MTGAPADRSVSLRAGVPEAAYLIRARLGVEVEQRFADSLADRPWVVEGLEGPDMHDVARVMREHAEPGFVGASAVVVARRLRVCRIAATHRPHFSSVAFDRDRPSQLVP